MMPPAPAAPAPATFADDFAAIDVLLDKSALYFAAIDVLLDKSACHLPS